MLHPSTKGLRLAGGRGYRTIKLTGCLEIARSKKDTHRKRSSQRARALLAQLSHVEAQEGCGIGRFGLQVRGGGRLDALRPGRSRGTAAHPLGVCSRDVLAGGRACPPAGDQQQPELRGAHEGSWAILAHQTSRDAAAAPAAQT
eukprot:scaffold14327_cov96-Isochrysis_galbana.AAC.1